MHKIAAVSHTIYWLSNAMQSRACQEKRVWLVWLLYDCFGFLLPLGTPWLCVVHTSTSYIVG